MLPAVSSRSFSLRKLTGSVACVLLAACSSDPAPSPGPPSSLRDVDASAVSARNIRVSWTPFGNGTVAILRAVSGSDAFTEVARKPGNHGRFLDLALDPDTTYAYRLARCEKNVCQTPYETEPVTTLPTEFPPIDLKVASSGFDDDIVVFGTYGISATLFTEGHMIAVDRAGRAIWEYATHEHGPISEVQPLANGTLATGQYQILVQIDLDGRELYRWSGGSAHHDIDRLPDGRFAFLFFDPFEVAPGVSWLGDGVHILDEAGAQVAWEWRAQDHIPVTDFHPKDIRANETGMGYNWTHANAITVDDEGTKVRINIRNLNRIYQVDVATKQTDWIMGDGGDFGEGLWDHCHDPEFLDDHHVLLFDNGMYRTPSHSRVIEVEFDPQQKTAQIVWEHRESPDFFSPALGSAHQQNNGNVFVTDGMNGRLFETTRRHEKVWELTVKKGFWIYKAVTVPRSFFTEW
ncbi:MAG: aryl-sulfate sulfotransferase [Polyangiaceae bacterium]|jgi:hypothetical protein|nr:aryl-sulfate sulfotransferase [Polyangiaceae bacterium]